jgi:hypothetical protein
LRDVRDQGRRDRHPALLRQDRFDSRSAVELWAAVTGQPFAKVATARTGNTGAVTFTVTSTATTRYQLWYASRRIVVAGKVIGAMERRAAPGDFRANLAQDGTAHPVTLTAQEHQVALTAATTLGLVVAGVDLLRTSDRPLTEVNPNPALTGITALLGDPTLYDQLARAVATTS